MAGKLYLIPTTLGKHPENTSIPDYTLDIVRKLDVFMVENLQSAVSFLHWVGDTVPEYDIEFYHLHKNTPDQEVLSFLKPLKQGKDAGVLSEAGAPGVADPGSRLVKFAHQHRIQVIPLSGPSSILLALMGSGFNGQEFAFHGYLPIEKEKRNAVIQQLEGESRRHRKTQIFMEAPHRNMDLLKTLLKELSPETYLCTATDLTLETEEIISRSVLNWSQSPIPKLIKRPTIFLISAR